MFLTQINIILITAYLSSVNCFIHPINLLSRRDSVFRDSLSLRWATECDVDEAANRATNRFVKRGQPSSPGWKNPSQFDILTEWVACDEANRAIICEYDPDALWLVRLFLLF